MTAPHRPTAGREGLAAGRAGRTGHFRIATLPPCPGRLCRASVTDLDNGRRFDALVDTSGLHLAARLVDLARSGQIDLLVSGVLQDRGRGQVLQTLHLEGVTPHADQAPLPPHRHLRRPSPRSHQQPPESLPRLLHT